MIELKSKSEIVEEYKKWLYAIFVFFFKSLLLLAVIWAVSSIIIYGQEG